MDLLRNLGSAAASSILHKSGIALPFTLGEKNIWFEGKSIWTLYDGIKRDDSSLVSIFLFDASQGGRRNLMPVAKNALRKLRTTRHPDVLKFIDAVETDTTIHIVTERVRPLGKVLSTWTSKPAKAKEEWLIWGLHRVSVALAFVNDSCLSTHGNIRTDSIFVSQSGEWRLGGFEVLSNPKDEAAILYTFGGLLPEASIFCSPEVKKSGWSVLKEHDPSIADGYSLGILLHFLFNPEHPLPATLQPPHPPPPASSRGSIPLALFPFFKKLLNPNHKARLSPKSFLESGMEGKTGEGFFSSNTLVRICNGLDSFALGSETEKLTLLRSLKDSTASFPPEFAVQRILPSLISSLEFGGASASVILPIVLQLGKSLPPDDQTPAIVNPIVKLFASSDRGTRMSLLDALPDYVDKLDTKVVVDKIWPNLQTGFTDTVAVIREATVRSVGLIYLKLNDRILNNDLLRHLAKMQMDPEPSIRTNTCILIGRLASSLNSLTKQKVLVPAFSRSLKDSFVHARVAGLVAFIATIDSYQPEDLATKVIPNMAFTLVDKEKLVRDQAFKAMELFMKRLENHVISMPDTVITNDPQPAMPGGLPEQSTIVGSAAGAAGALAGWAISSLGKTLASSDITSSIGSIPNRPASAPLPPQTNGNNLTAPSPTRSSFSSASVGPPRAKGMQLGVKKPLASSIVLAESSSDNSADLEDAWGHDDLIDVNADADDWNAFQSAPADSAMAVLSSPPQASYGDPSLNDYNPWEDTSASTVKGLTAFPLETRPTSTPSKPASTLPPRSRAISDEWGSINDQIVQPQSEPPSNPSSPPLSTVGLSKEEKAAEMARRRDERKQRIAQLKEQKKTAGAKS